MQLKNGRFIADFFDFKVRDFWDTESVAHSLSIQTRFTGHTFFPISIAQHLLLTSDLAITDNQPKEVVLACHIHDCSESFSGDVNRCIKHLPGMEVYRKREKDIELEIFEFHGIKINPELIDLVHYYDNIALSTEAYYSMNYKEDCWQRQINDYSFRLDFKVEERNWKEVKLDWLNRYFNY